MLPGAQPIVLRIGSTNLWLRPQQAVSPGRLIPQSSKLTANERVRVLFHQKALTV
jgi:hypothetical protein